ncbi:MAG: hypothetical protein V1810_00275 [Candidatus Beckwithbacteria bacterium]
MDLELTELHVHVGVSVSATMLWEMAHDQGIKLPTKDYWEFEKLVTLQKKESLNDYLEKFKLTELIQSSPEAMFTAIETAISGAFRKNNITVLELRYNPLFRNRGVVGIDLAGAYSGGTTAKMIKPLVDQARAAGLGITIHSGETADAAEMWEVVRKLRPERIGHGIACVRDKKLMRYLAKEEIVLEVCPTSNINAKVVKGYAELKSIFKALLEYGVKFTINTDGPEMQQVNLREERRRLAVNQVLTEKQLLIANQIAKEASFIHE